MISSKSFPENDLEDISAHCFRATLAVNKYKEGGAFIAQNALNHKKVETTLAHYIKINERDIDLKEENKYKNNKTIISSFNFFDGKENLQEDTSSNNEDQEMENMDLMKEDKFTEKDEDLIFDSDGKNLLDEEKAMFVGKKRKLKDSIITNDELISSKRTYENLFDSILDNSKKTENEQEEIIKNALKESNRLFVPTIQPKRISYLSSVFIPENVKQEECLEPDGDIVNKIIIKNRKCIFDTLIIKKSENIYN